jgi:hypothetical protein
MKDAFEKVRAVDVFLSYSDRTGRVVPDEDAGEKVISENAVPSGDHRRV